MKVVPDTSVIIEGVLSKKLEAKELEAEEIIIHEAVLAELEHQANQNKAIGFLGLDEIKKLRLNYNVRFSGVKPKASEIRNASLGEIDSLIRDLAYNEDATLLTSDNVQHKVAESKGIKVIYIEQVGKKKKLKLESYFDETTMSVHLKEDVEPYAKKGMPGSWKFVKLGENKLRQTKIKDISR